MFFVDGLFELGSWAHVEAVGLAWSWNVAASFGTDSLMSHRNNVGQTYFSILVR